MKNRCPCCRWLVRRQQSQYPTTSITQVTTYDDRRSPPVSTRISHATDETPKENLCLVNGKEIIEMEDYNSSNGSISKKDLSTNKKGEYISIPTSSKNETSLL